PRLVGRVGDAEHAGVPVDRSGEVFNEEAWRNGFDAYQHAPELTTACVGRLELHLRSVLALLHEAKRSAREEVHPAAPLPAFGRLDKGRDHSWETSERQAAQRAQRDE